MSENRCSKVILKLGDVKCLVVLSLEPHEFNIVSKKSFLGMSVLLGTFRVMKFNV